MDKKGKEENKEKRDDNVLIFNCIRAFQCLFESLCLVLLCEFYFQKKTQRLLECSNRNLS